MDRKILLVDDEKDIADLIEEVLRQDSFKNINTTLQLFKRNAV